MRIWATMLRRALAVVLAAGMGLGGALQAEDKPSPFPQRRPRLTFRDLVKRAQEKLKQEGYYNGFADGAMNSETRSAVKRYQLDKGLHADGRVNRETAQRLGLVLILGGPQTPEAR